VCHCISVYPCDATVIDVGDLKHRVHSWITGTSLAENNLSHPPLIIELLCNLLLSLDDHPIASLNAEECRWVGSSLWADGFGQMINAH
jgi:hypothetical protein